MRKILKFVVVAQLHPKTLQNRPLVAVDGGLIDPHRVGHFGFCAFFPKQLFDQPPLLSGYGANHMPQQAVVEQRG